MGKSDNRGCPGSISCLSVYIYWTVFSSVHSPRDVSTATSCVTRWTEWCPPVNTNSGNLQLLHWIYEIWPGLAETSHNGRQHGETRQTHLLNLVIEHTTFNDFCPQFYISIWILIGHIHLNVEFLMIQQRIMVVYGIRDFRFCGRLVDNGRWVLQKWERICYQANTVLCVFVCMTHLTYECT